MTVQEVEHKTYVWAHVGVIIYHTLVGILLVVARFRNNIFGVNRLTLVLALGIILIITSLLALKPILNKHDEIIIK